MLCITIDELIIIGSIMCIFMQKLNVKRNFGKSILKPSYILHINKLKIYKKN